jgi:glucose-1-phosphate adenylyltransferase
MKNVVAVVLGGGRGTRLQPLTFYRSKPAVPLAGKYRLIDIPLSNCLNSGLNQIYVLTQFMSVSLHRHIRGTYNFDVFDGGFVEILAAQQTFDCNTEDWFQGTADAVRKNLRYLSQPEIDHVLILSGDQLYRMDFAKMLETHLATNADVTIAAKPVNRSDASGLGIMRVDDSGRVVGFLEKPQTDTEFTDMAMSPEWINSQGVTSHGREFLASMGIYLFTRDTLIDVLEKTNYQDFGKEVFPASIRSRHVQLHPFDGYWEDIGTIASFYEANLQLAQTDPPFDLTSESSPIYSRPRFLPPSRVDGAAIRGSLIADGCVIERGTTIENSVIGLRCQIGRNVTIRNSVIMGADFYETAERMPQGTCSAIPSVGIGEGTLIEGALVDKNCRIGAGVTIRGNPERHDEPLGEHCAIRDGIFVVPKDGVIPDNWTG